MHSYTAWMATSPMSTILGMGWCLGTDTGTLPPWPRRPDCSVPSDRPVTQNIRRHAGHAVSDDHCQFVETNSLQRCSRIRQHDRHTVAMPAVTPTVQLQWKNEFHRWNHDSSVQLFHDGTCPSTDQRIHFLTSSLTEINTLSDEWRWTVTPLTSHSRFTASLSFQYWCSSAYPSVCVPYSSPRMTWPRMTWPTCRISFMSSVDWQLTQFFTDSSARAIGMALTRKICSRYRTRNVRQLAISNVKQKTVIYFPP